MEAVCVSNQRHCTKNPCKHLREDSEGYGIRKKPTNERASPTRIHTATKTQQSYRKRVGGRMFRDANATAI